MGVQLPPLASFLITCWALRNVAELITDEDFKLQDSRCMMQDTGCIMQDGLCMIRCLYFGQ
jgi:hypothetical protein